jgi:hypothetical protein
MLKQKPNQNKTKGLSIQLHPFYHVPNKKAPSINLEMRLVRPRSAGALILGFPASKTVRNKLLLFKSTQSTVFC